jgi:DnaJ family protein A protein 2
MNRMDLYERLGVSKDADTNEIKKAFKKLAMTHHPDKGGDPEEFKKIQHAHEVLTDEQKRRMYDMTGSDNGEMPQGGPFGGGMPFDMGDLFGGLFGGMGPMGMGPMGMGGRQAPGMRVKRPQGPPKTIEIPLTLKDFYHGKALQVKFERHKFCEVCKGEGATSFQSCSTCRGQGVVRQVMMMGPIQMVNEGPCRDCMGQGKKPSGNCYVCGGKKTKAQEKTIEVKIEPGMRPGEVLVFPKECSDDPNYEEPGDVHFLLQDASGDEGWIRKGDDLETHLKLNLSESLLGCTKTLQGHPGYPQGLEVQIPFGVQNGETVLVQEKGMTKKSGGFGSLHCKIGVQLQDKEREILKRNEPLLKAMFT